MEENKYEKLKKKIERMFPVEFLDHINFTCGELNRETNTYSFTFHVPWDKVQPIVEKKEKEALRKMERKQRDYEDLLLLLDDLKNMLYFKLKGLNYEEVIYDYNENSQQFIDLIKEETLKFLEI